MQMPIKNEFSYPVRHLLMLKAFQHITFSAKLGRVESVSAVLVQSMYINLWKSQTTLIATKNRIQEILKESEISIT